MGRWLFKSEPASYGWDDLVRDGGTEWDGVRNAAAAGHLRAMAVGDEALIYHSGEARAVVGLAVIARAARPDGQDDRWVSVRVEPVTALPRPVALATMKATPALTGMAMLRQPRLSVAPLTAEEWEIVMRLAGAQPFVTQPAGMARVSGG
ncbi:Predicted RNA-binding protein, contains PUA-like domain [Sphingomonas gellani]|uniref:Predicted RNA-binding protein, contains PUA-like domain n=1 Tax=Sphingomonas gellani TaxID=1166340 RepID=A0A1H8BAD5_9SPHN|nr:EVE domain-containing protein [Sphingomonas gellani]SEM79054.1 Predicted RNA-binding protein, contains PUA-like domain [Sphingomonas gellani]